MTTQTLTASHPSSFAAGVWRVADPKITLASVASMLVGAAAAAWQGGIAWGWLLLTVLGVFCVEAAKNASGEIFDWDSGADQAVREDERSPFSGGKRVIVDGLLTRAQTAIVAIQAYGAELKDPATGLLDFPAMRGDSPVYLCWRYGEPRIGFWHPLETGIAGRQPLDEE